MNPTQNITFTPAQADRLRELGKNTDETMTFDTAALREAAYKKFEKEQIARGKKRLEAMKAERGRPSLPQMQEDLAQALIAEGFIQVTTPTIISKKFLERMTIDDTHALHSQVFWVDNNKCLRPMLAPNLYEISRNLLGIWKKPVRVFEIGSCFRKESQGSRHLNEFTMLNLVEWGTPMDERDARIRELAAVVMRAAGIEDYGFEQEDSVVYGDTIDVVQGDVELGSSSKGPHDLDPAWGITDTWVGIGFGLERLIMTRDKAPNIHSVGRSVSYLDGVRLNIK